MEWAVRQRPSARIVQVSGKGSLLKDAGIPAAAAMELIGHDSEQMSQHYTHVGHEALRKAAGALPDMQAAAST